MTSLCLRRCALVTSAVTVLLGGLPAGAAEPGGVVKKATGDVWISRGGERVVATVGTAIIPLDKILTGPKASAGITLNDDTLLSLGPDSSLVLEKFAFDATTQNGSVALRILRGALALVTGLIGRLQPEAVSVATPTTIIGIRGTEFIVEVPGND